MSWDWGTINAITDDVLVTAGILVLIARQFLWRDAALRPMLRMPLVIVAAGLVYLVVEVGGSAVVFAPGDWFIAGELVLVALTGTAMGAVTRFRAHEKRLQYRLSGPGILLWAVFLGVRIGMFALASAFGADLAGATGFVLLSFGINRLAAIRVVERRARLLLSEIAGSASPGPT